MCVCVCGRHICLISIFRFALLKGVFGITWGRMTSANVHGLFHEGFGDPEGWQSDLLLKG